MQYVVRPENRLVEQFIVRIIAQVGNSLSIDTFVINFYEDPISFSRNMSKIVKNAPRVSCNVKESFKKFLDPDPFQTLMTST